HGLGADRFGADPGAQERLRRDVLRERPISAEIESEAKDVLRVTLVQRVELGPLHPSRPYGRRARRLRGTDGAQRTPRQKSITTRSGTNWRRPPRTPFSVYSITSGAVYCPAGGGVLGQFHELSSTSPLTSFHANGGCGKKSAPLVTTHAISLVARFVAS